MPEKFAKKGHRFGQKRTYGKKGTFGKKKGHLAYGSGHMVETSKFLYGISHEKIIFLKFPCKHRSIIPCAITFYKRNCLIRDISWNIEFLSFLVLQKLVYGRNRSNWGNILNNLWTVWQQLFVRSCRALVLNVSFKMLQSVT